MTSYHVMYHVTVEICLFIVQKKKKKKKTKEKENHNHNQNKILESKYTITYTDYVLVVYRVDSSVTINHLLRVLLRVYKVDYC